MRLVMVCAIVALTLAACAQAAWAQLGEASDKWGTLSGRITFTGKAPDVKKLKTLRNLNLRRLARDRPPVAVESLIVHPRNRGLANAVIWLARNSDAEIPVHPNFAKTADSIRSIVPGETRLAPHIMTIRAGQTLSIDNSNQKRAACLMAGFLKNEQINPLINPGETFAVEIKKAERLPVRFGGSILPWLSAYVLVQDHPYMSVTDENGRFEMRNIPAGNWQFRFWHEEFGYLRDLKLNGIETEFPKGLRTISIERDYTEIGKIELAESAKLR